MKIHKLTNYTTLKIFSVMGYISFAISIYIATHIHDKYFYINDCGKYIYKNLSQKGDYEFLILFFGGIIFIIHLILIISWFCEILIKKDLIIQKTYNQNSLKKIFLYIGFILNISPYIVSGFLEIIKNEFLLLINL